MIQQGRCMSVHGKDKDDNESWQPLEIMDKNVCNARGRRRIVALRLEFCRSGQTRGADCKKEVSVQDCSTDMSETWILSKILGLAGSARSPRRSNSRVSSSVHCSLLEDVFLHLAARVAEDGIHFLLLGCQLICLRSKCRLHLPKSFPSSLAPKSKPTPRRGHTIHRRRCRSRSPLPRSLVE